MPHREMTAQAQRVGELLEQGYTRRQIAERLGVSSPRVTQIIGTNPELTRYQRRPGQAAMRLYSYRQDLIRLRHATLDLAKVIRRELRELDEELEAYEVDRLLGLRAG